MRRWPLTTLLALAASRERAARAELAAALAREAELRGAQVAAETLAARNSAAEGRAIDRLGRGACGAALGDAARHLSRLRQETARRREEVRAAEAALAAASGTVEARERAAAAARAAVDALERHRERWRASEERRRGRAEEAEGDDLVNGRRRATP